MRDDFLLDPALTFLNHGSFGACPRPVFDAFQRWQLELERNPVEFLGRRSGLLLAESRRRLAGYLNADADELAYLPNATTAVNVVARSLTLAPGDEVLATDLEYGACDATWQHVCAARGAVYRRVAIALPFDRAAFVARLLGAATARTRLVFASHIASTTALVLPVGALCAAARERGLQTLIDGAHAPGQVDVDLAAIGADWYAGNCHKWLCAPKSVGFLHARHEHHAAIEPPVISWGYAAGSGGHSGFDAYAGATLLERRLQWQGTQDIAARLAVPDAIDYQAARDWPVVRARCHALAVDAMQQVAARHGLPPIGGDDDFAQMAPLPVPAQDAEALRRRLFEQQRIEVPVTQHAGRTFVRLSVQGYNDAGDVERLVRALA